MFEQNTKNRTAVKLAGIFICISAVIIITVNILNMNRFLHQQSEMQGEARLETVSNNMQRTLDKSKITLMRFAADVESYIAKGADTSEMRGYLKSQSSVFRDQSEGTLMNAYICTEDYVILSDSSLPDNYVLNERNWYMETMKSGIENICITAPYLDFFTEQMCFTASMLLSDGKTVIGLDFNLSRIQDSVAQMSHDENGETLILTRDGLVVGCSEPEYSGRDLNEVMPEYAGIYSRLLYEEGDSIVLNADIRGENCTVFCNRSGDWFFIYTVTDKGLNSQPRRIILLNFVPRIGMLAVFFCYYLYVRKKIKGIDFSALPQKEVNADEITAAAGDITGITKSSRNGIMFIMGLTILVAVVFSGIVLVKWGDDRMEHEVDSYNYQLESWMNTQLTTLNMFVDTISANPAVLDDYEKAVDYLDTIVKNYPEISAAYIARPGNEHEMTMNNGWVPNADYIVAERQWYRDTENSDTKMSVSSPYLDARTGLYCVTFSRVVYDAKTKEQIGIFALDFYIGNLTGIMEESYSDSGYAFLVDNSNIIVNHPNSEYQTSGDRSVNISGTQYSGIKNSPTIRFIRDYDGKTKVCIARTEAVTGFSVIAVKDITSIYGIAALGGGIFIVLLAVCIVLLFNLIVKMMNWQENARQALIAEAQRASQADHAKSSFLAQMSHEIRTPINAVLGMNEMILHESTEENILKYASNAYNSGNALLSIINDILDISKIEAGRLEIDESEYDLYSLIGDCYHMTLNRAEKKGLEFRLVCDENLPSRLKGDMFHIRQIAVNLITNGIKYTDKGSVELTFSQREAPEGILLCFSVKDTGIGLRPENIEKLFDSFQRFDLERNRSVEGTGLGLSICKQLTELMGGSIGVESVYGEGSVFICEIPQKIVTPEPIGVIRLDRTPDREETEEHDSFEAPGAHILVVDDVEMNLFVFTSYLKEHKMHIDTALSGKKCLELVKENNYDIIFMDHMMPEMDGIETFENMRRNNLISPETPVVMLTANAISGEEEKYLSAGFASYLTKPIQIAKLDNVLLKYLPEEKVIPVKQTRKTAPGEVSHEINEVFDPAAGISYSSGNKEIFETALRMYVTSGEKKPAEISELAEAENWSDYITEVHALKSTSLTAGSKLLSERAKELELAGRNGDYALLKEKTPDLIGLYKKVLEEGRKYLAENGIPLYTEHKKQSGGRSGELSEEMLTELVSRLQSACDNFDGDAVDEICDENQSALYKGKSLAPLLEEIRAAVDDFEYEDAAEKAGHIIEQLNETE